MIATIGVSNLPTGTTICTPATWNVLSTQGTAGTTATPSSGSSPNQVTEESFYTSQTTAAGTYTVNFRTNCANAATGVGVGASDVAVNYTGVDTDDAVRQRHAGIGHRERRRSDLAGARCRRSDELDRRHRRRPLRNRRELARYDRRRGREQQLGEHRHQRPGRAAARPRPFAGGQHDGSPLDRRNRGVEAGPADVDHDPGCPRLLAHQRQQRPPARLGHRARSRLGDDLPARHELERARDDDLRDGREPITQTDFWTTASTTYAFTFNSSSTCQGNNLVSAAASAVATNYAGVSAVSVLSKATPNGGSPAKVLTAPDVTTQSPDSEVVSTFATLDSWSSGTKPALQNATSPWVNAGADSALQPVAGDQTSPQQEQTNNVAPWTGITVALSPLLSSSLTVTPPTGYVGGGSDLMLVTIAVNNLGTGSICAPDSTWSRVPLATAGLDVYTVSSGTVTQAAFYTSTSEASSDVFSFYAKPNCEGAPLGVGASAVAVYYTGVDTASPFDVTPVLASGSSATLQPGAITTTVAGDELVSLFGSGATSLNSTIAVAGNGLAPAGGVNNVNPPPQHNPGANTPASATSNASASWTAETIALQPLLKTGIIVQRPPTPNQNDFLVVTVTATGLTSGNICAPNDGTWTELNGAMTTETANGLTTDQATWYGFRGSASPESYTFTFNSNASCSASGTPLTASATALAVRFTGVNPITPVDENAQGLVTGTTKGPGSTNAVGLGATVSPPHTGDWAVTMFGTGATGLTMPGCSPSTGGNPPYSGFQSGTTGTASATGFCGRISPAANANFAMGSATASSTGKPWITDTLVLKSASGGCGSGCEYGIEDPDDPSYYTDYALAIQAAKQQLQNLVQTDPSRSGAQDVIILLSDGDANFNPTTTKTASNYTPFPCNDGIQQAEAAESPTGLDAWFFSIAYGSPYQTSDNSCSLDNSGTAQGTTGILHNLTAQCTMELMANNVITDPALGSDANAQTQLCPANTEESGDPAHRFYNVSLGSSLKGVFQQIGSSLSTPRLISDAAS